MLDSGKWEQYGVPREEGVYGIYGITIHEFNDSSKTAQDIYQYLNEESKENEAWHYAVDANGPVELMPLDYAVYHTGKMMDWGDEHTVAVILCNNDDDTVFEESIDELVSLVCDLMEEYELTYKDVFFHNDFNPVVHCPDRLLNTYGSSISFDYTKLM